MRAHQTRGVWEKQPQPWASGTTGTAPRTRSGWSPRPPPCRITATTSGAAARQLRRAPSLHPSHDPTPAIDLLTAKKTLQSIPQTTPPAPTRNEIIFNGKIPKSRTSPEAETSSRLPVRRQTLGPALLHAEPGLGCLLWHVPRVPEARHK